MINELPDDAVDLHSLTEKLHLLQQIEKGEEDIKAGRVIMHEQLVERMAAWRQSAERSHQL